MRRPNTVDISGRMMKYEIDARNIDEFVGIFDQRANDPGAEEYFFRSGFKYNYRVRVDTTLDPYSDAYFDQQVALYEEISGRKLDQHANEPIAFDIEAHVHRPNPYLEVSPAGMPLHIQRLSKGLRFGDLPAGARVLDFGAGHGVSSELAAYLGFRVTAIDINPHYVELINRRARRSGLPIEAVCSAFDDFQAAPDYDAAVFYESLHHATKPWETLRHVSGLLKPDGKALLVCEPINDVWWPNWGLRLDAVSVWAIRKFGWFESGWSRPFLERMMRDAGLEPVLVPDGDLAIGILAIGLKPRANISYRPPAPRPARGLSGRLRRLFGGA